MARAIRLFVSSSPDMETEREMAGLAVAELPISQGWEIRHTPRPGESTTGALAFLAGCDLYVVILGADFAAPMGLEWNEAQRAAKALLAYRKLVLHSPAAQEFIRRAGVKWVDFTSPQEFKERFSRELAQMLLDRGETLGLHVEDVEALLALVQQEEKEAQAPADLERRRGAGHGGIILGRPG
jgi:hypothetical protein